MEDKSIDSDNYKKKKKHYYQTLEYLKYTINQYKSKIE